MGWSKMKGTEGLVFVPDEPDPESRKHACPDCYVCQHCSDERCARCLSRKADEPCRSSCRRGKKKRPVVTDLP